jgi:hypothetical protein
MSLPQPNEQYPIRLGASFKSDTVGSGTHIHTVHYSFLPASADLKQNAAMAVDSDGATRIEFHNVNAGGASVCMTSSAKSQVSKRDCILIFDAAEQCFVLEKLASSTRDVKKAATQFDPTLLPRPTRQPQQHVRLNASSADQVKLTQSSQINRLLEDDNDADDDDDDDDEVVEGDWKV